jgi:multiple sugar transport system substrate-binding protein
MRDLLLPQLDEVDRKTIDYINNLTPYIGALPPTPPQGAGEVAIILQGIGHEIAFNQINPKQGGEKLVREAVAALSK